MNTVSIQQLLTFHNPEATETTAEEWQQCRFVANPYKVKFVIVNTIITFTETF